MTFLVAFARPPLALVAADTRLWTYDPDGALRSVRDDVDKVLPAIDGWIALGGDNRISELVGRTLANVPADRVVMAERLERLRPTIAAAVARLPEPVAARIRAGECAAVLRVTRDQVWTIDWWTGAMEARTDALMFNPPPPPHTDSVEALVADYGAWLGDLTTVGWLEALEAIRRAGALVGAVHDQCGPAGPVSDRVAIGVLWDGGQGRVRRLRLPPMASRVVADQPAAGFRAQLEGVGISVTTRIIEIRRKLLIDGDAGVVLSSRPEDLTDALVRPRAAPRVDRDPNAVREPTVEAYFRQDPFLQTTLTVRLSARPTGTSLFYYVDDATVAPPVLGSASWLAYAGAFNVAQSTVDKMVSAYAQLGDKLSPVRSWRIPSKLTPQVASSTTQETGGSPMVRLRRNFEFSSDVVAWQLYRRRRTAAQGVAYPTLDGTAGGVLDAQYFKGEKSVGDLPARDVNGTILANGTFGSGSQAWSGTAFEDGGADPVYTTNDFVQDILIPIDANGVPGNRFTASYQITNTATPQLDAFSRSLNTAGTSCSARRKYNFSWTPNAGVADGTHHVIVFGRHEPDGAWVNLFTEGSPATVTSKTAQEVPFWGDGSGFTLGFKIELRKDADSSIIQTRFAANDGVANQCSPFWPN